MSATTTLTGRLGGLPELKFSQNGKAVASFSMVTERRQFNKQSNEWESASTTWWRCSAFGELAENLCESFTEKGAAVIVTGRLEEESWTDKATGQKRTAIKMLVDDMGPSLKYATATVTKATRSGNGQSQGQSRSPGQSAQQSGGWGSAGGTGGQGGWSGSADAPPF